MRAGNSICLKEPHAILSTGSVDFFDSIKQTSTINFKNNNPFFQVKTHQSMSPDFKMIFPL